MKKFIFFFIVCVLSAGAADAQNILKSLARTAKSQAEFTATSTAANTVRDGVNNVLSGRLFGKKKNTSKGTDESLISYLNPQLGFKGQYPKSYTRSEEEGQVIFSSSKGDIIIVFCGEDETTLDEMNQKVLDEVNANYELLNQDKKGDNFTIQYNTGGTLVNVHAIAKDSRVATVMIAYPEDEAASYKKLITNVQKSLQFFK